MNKEEDAAEKKKKDWNDKPKKKTVGVSVCVKLPVGKKKKKIHAVKPNLKKRLFSGKTFSDPFNGCVGVYYEERSWEREFNGEQLFLKKCQCDDDD